MSFFILFNFINSFRIKRIKCGARPLLGYDPRYPSIEDLRNLAKRRCPKFAFEYLDGGCNENVNVTKNTKEIRDVELIPKYLPKTKSASLKTEVFG